MQEVFQAVLERVDLCRAEAVVPGLLDLGAEPDAAVARFYASGGWPRELAGAAGRVGAGLEVTVAFKEGDRGGDAFLRDAGPMRDVADAHTVVGDDAKGVRAGRQRELGLAFVVHGEGEQN